MCSTLVVAEVRTSTSKLEFPYSRTTGPVVGAFLRGLGEGRIVGVRDMQGRVIVPPVEYDPQTGAPLADALVDVGVEGTVEAWTWVAEPLERHPLGRPFAFALVRPDGADTSLVHAVDAGDATAMVTGMRVAARFADEPEGRITDLVCWGPVAS
jgi:uncharacterized OB-fold protein